MARHFDVPLIEAKGLCFLLLRLRDYFGQQHKVGLRWFLTETLGDQESCMDGVLSREGCRAPMPTGGVHEESLLELPS